MPDNATAPLTYRLVMACAAPVVRRWCRLQVDGADLLRQRGPIVLIANHDSAWDPVILGVAAGSRQLHGVAKAELWTHRPLAWVLDRMQQIPIERGRADAQALAKAIDRLRDGQCVGLFPEGTVSRGRTLKPMSGAGRLIQAVPDTRVVCAAVIGATDVVRFPRRPRITVRFFDCPLIEGESAIALTRRTMAQVRTVSPPAIPGRRRAAARFRAAVDAAG